MSRAVVLVADADARSAADALSALRDDGLRETSVVAQPARLAARVRRARPALLVVDTRFGDDGIELVAGLPREERPKVVFVGPADARTVQRAARVGCAGLVVKPYGAPQLVATVRLALETSREAAVSAEAQATLGKITALLEEARGEARGDGALPAVVVPASLDLSPREREVVGTLLRYGRVARVARALHISTHTARNHLKTVYQKLDVHSLDELFDRVHDAANRRPGSPRPVRRG